MSTGTTILEQIRERQDEEHYQDLSWEGSFAEYLERVRERPEVTRTAYQRLHDMIVSHGREEYTELRERVVRHRLFDDPIDDGRDAVFGIDEHLMRLVAALRSAAHGYGTDRRVLLLHGPVGSAKSTIVRLLKKGLEAYSRTTEGALYTFAWRSTEDDDRAWVPCPMHEEPLHLVPVELRPTVERQLNEGQPDRYQVSIRGELCPLCRHHYRARMADSGGDWTGLLDHVRVRRLVLREQDRVGIGTFQPKDEKNQDSTELTGDINYRKIAIFGSDSDPRAFNFDGEFNVANRGIIEFVELLKLEVAFLYDLLTATQEHRIKPKKFAQTDIDEVIIGHTNEPEYRRLQGDEFMEALRDRTIRLDVPYITRLRDEVRIYRKEFPPERLPVHVAPHTFEVASMWAILTRLEDPGEESLSLLQKLKLYDGASLPGFTDDRIRDLRARARREGLEGISPRYVQDQISNALVRAEVGCLNPFMVLNELEGGLKHHTLVASDDLREHYRELLRVVQDEFENRAKNEVQRAIATDDEGIERLCRRYVANVKAYTQGERIRNEYTGQDEGPDEQLMRSIEENIEIAEGRKDAFRREIMNFIGARALEGKPFDHRSHERLQRGLELKLFEDQKDTIRFTALVQDLVDNGTREQLEVVKDRLIRSYGYCEICANDILTYVSSIFARGSVGDGS